MKKTKSRQQFSTIFNPLSHDVVVHVFYESDYISGTNSKLKWKREHHHKPPKMNGISSTPFSYLFMFCKMIFIVFFCYWNLFFLCFYRLLGFGINRIFDRSILTLFVE